MNGTIKNATTDTAIFEARLKRYKALIDKDIAAYARQVEASTLAAYGPPAQTAISAYLQILGRGGKRIRGALTMLGYEMMGGKNQSVIVQAARVMEMSHAYLLLIDDIQDRSKERRGGPAAHVALADYHRKNHWAGEPEHFGEAIAINAALAGNHAAQMVLANLDAPAELRLKAVSILNRTLLVTSHGQNQDMVNEAKGQVSELEVERVLEWKTANYTVLNPLHMGMVLAGADCAATDAITPGALALGKAYQITNDILGVFGGPAATESRGSRDDIREGKRTVLSVYALLHANPADKKFLASMLGKQKLTEAEFKRCQKILTDSGALAHARQLTKQYINQAVSSFDHQTGHWNQDGTQFLGGLADYLLKRCQHP